MIVEGLQLSCLCDALQSVSDNLLGSARRPWGLTRVFAAHKITHTKRNLKLCHICGLVRFQFIGLVDVILNADEGALALDCLSLVLLI